MKFLIKKSLWIFAAASALALISYFFWDQEISLYFNQEHFYRFRRVSRYATDVGEGGPWFVLSILSYVFFRWAAPHLKFFDEKFLLIRKYRSWFAFLFSSLAALGIFTQILKILVGRQRPHRSPTFENFYFVPFNFHWHWHSFPSGHSELLFVVATCLSFLWPRHTGPLLMTAFVFALTRVFTHHHFLSDVIMGSMIGYVGVLWIKFYFDRKQLTQF